MKAVILADECGSSSGSPELLYPKCLTQLGSRTLIERTIESLRLGGSSRIGIVTGRRADLIVHFADRVFFNANWAETNTVASLIQARDWLAREPVIVSASDLIYTPETIEALISSKAALSIAYDPDWRSLWSARFSDEKSGAQSFRLDNEGHVVEIGDRPAGPEAIQGRYTGLLKMTPVAWSIVRAALSTLQEDDKQRLDITGLLSLLVRRGVPVKAIEQRGVWGECSSEADFSLYARWIKEGRIAA